MIHNDHVNLIAKEVTKGKSVWADFGSGWGAFTLALRDIGGPEIEIHSIDKNKESLKEQKAYFDRRFSTTKIQYHNKDFTQELELPELDAILMANSLHYIEDQIDFLKQLKKYLKPGGKLIIVEYDTNKITSWLPFPFDFNKFSEMAEESGYSTTSLLEKKDLEGISIYSAVTFPL